MGNIFRRRRHDWVPPNEKLELFMAEAKKGTWASEESMRGWKIGKDGTTFAKALADNESCFILDLSYNGLGDKEAEALGEALRKNNTIKRLILANNHIHEDGADALADAFQPPAKGGAAGADQAMNRSLIALNLMNNSIGTGGAEAIARAMGTAGDTLLQDVNLQWNNIGVRGIMQLLQAAQSKKMKRLDLRYNEVPDDPDFDPDPADLDGEDPPMDTIAECLRECKSQGKLILIDPKYE